MKAELSFTFESLEELHDFTAKMARPYPVSGSAEVAVASPVAAEEPRTTKIRKTTIAAGPDVGEVQASEMAKAPVAEKAGSVTEADVRKAITDVNDKFGLVPARKVLTQFGVKRIPELKPEQYADFVKACNAVK